MAQARKPPVPQAGSIRRGGRSLAKYLGAYRIRRYCDAAIQFGTERRRGSVSVILE